MCFYKGDSVVKSKTKMFSNKFIKVNQVYMVKYKIGEIDGFR